MKVIKKVDISSWTHQIKCVKCDSDLEIEAKDLRHTHYSGDARESSSDSYSVSCAVCHNIISIPSNAIPKLAQIEAQNRSKPSAGSYYDR